MELCISFGVTSLVRLKHASTEQLHQYTAGQQLGLAFCFLYSRVQCDLLFNALAVGNCITMQQAQTPTSDSPNLQSLHEDLKCRFLAAVAAAAQGQSSFNFTEKEQAHRTAAFDLCGVLPKEPNRDDLAAKMRERPPWIERGLYMILHDRTLRQADPTEALKRAIVATSLYRLRAARMLKPTSKILQNVPEAARNRFFELISTHKVYRCRVHGVARQAALWSNDVLSFEQALQLDEDSECLQCLPRELRTHFRMAINTAQPEGNVTSTKEFNAVPPQENSSWLTSLATQLLHIGCKLVPESWHTPAAAAATTPDEPDNPKLSSKIV
eukprot:14332-Heterococcus_DN1.PRE.2